MFTAVLEYYYYDYYYTLSAALITVWPLGDRRAPKQANRYKPLSYYQLVTAGVSKQVPY